MNRELRRQQARQERLDKKKGGAASSRQQAAQRVAGSKTAPDSTERRGLRQYLREVRQELSKVAWPDRQTLTTYTAVSLIATVALTAYTAFLDIAFKQTFVDFILR